MIKLKELLTERENVKLVRITVTPMLFNMFRSKAPIYKNLLRRIGRMPKVGEEVEVSVNHVILGKLYNLIGKENVKVIK